MKKIFSLFLVTIMSQALFSQSTYIPLGTDEYKQLDRMEALIGGSNPYYMSALKPYSRWESYRTAEEFDESIRLFNLRNIHPTDIYNIKRVMDLNGEWGKGNYTYYDATPRQPRPILRYFYHTAQHMLLYSQEDYFVSINPVLYLQGAIDEYSEDLGYLNRRGVEVRARLFNSIGVYTTISDNQERLPKYLDKVGQAWKAYPGFTDHTGRTQGRPYDAFYARAYVDIPVIRDHIEMTFGFDKNFIGDGIRSMILSDLAGPYSFLRIRYNYGRFFYQNLFMELMPDYYGRGDREIPRKYASIHYLGFKVNPKIELGLVESNNYDMSKIKPQLFMPVILERSAQRILNRGNDNFRNSLAFTTKVIWGRNIMSYTQLNVQNMDFNGDNNWKNQYAYQVGVKYFNVASIPQLDAQAEWNGATPFMYSSNKATKNFTHYNQPLAHHLESAFNEYIVKLSYQPLRPLRLEWMLSQASGSSKTGHGNNGSDVFLPYTTRFSNHGYKFNGDGSFRSFHTAITGSYEVFPNMFIDAGMHYVNSSSKIDSRAYSNFLLYTGIRINAPKRMYDWNQ